MISGTAAISDGCSGGISWLYSLFGETISIEQCCHRHDIDYELGGSGAERKGSDRRLRECALEKAGGNAWKRARAWIVWALVRLFGWSSWANNPVRVAAIRARLKTVEAWTSLAAFTGQAAPRRPRDENSGGDGHIHQPRHRRHVQL